MAKGKSIIGHLNTFAISERFIRRPDVPKLTRDNDLDLMRFLLAACVVFYHGKILIGGLDFAYARISVVSIFLFLSGLLITESYYSSPTLKSYIEKRVRRIYPGYITVVLLGGLIAAIGWMLFSSQSVSLASLGTYWGFNAVFANWMAPCVIENAASFGGTCEVNGSLWIMKWEVVFYTLLPIFLMIFSRLHKILIGLVLIGLTVLVSVETLPYLRIFQCFLMGICAYYLKPVWMGALSKLPPIPQLLRQGLLFLGFMVSAYLHYGLFILVLMAITFYPSTSGPRINIMKFGDISYGVFLIHFPLMTGAFQFLPPEIFGPWVSFVVLALSAILAIIMHKFIEARFLLPSSYYRKQVAD